MKHITWLQPGDPPARVSARGARRWTIRPACWRPAGTSRQSACTRPTSEASFPGTRPGEPVLWWSPDPREVLVPGEMHVSRSLQRTLRRGDLPRHREPGFRRGNRRLRGGPRTRQPAPGSRRRCRPPTSELHARGVAHSIEVWCGRRARRRPVRGAQRPGLLRRIHVQPPRRRLQGGAGVAGAALRAERGIELIDCQMPSAHLRSLGSRPLPRRQFVEFLER